MKFLDNLNTYITLARVFRIKRKNYRMNVYVKELKLIYISIHKAGNTSIRDLLLKKLDFDNYENVQFKSDDVFQYLTTKEVFESRDCFKFSFVRNPFDRLVSCYKDKILHEGYLQIINGYGNMFYKGMSFDIFVKNVCKVPDFLADEHFKSQYSDLFYRGNLIVDFLGKVENMHKDFAIIQEKFDLSDMSHLNRSPNKSDYRDFYTPELVQLVYKRYEKDINAFGYKEDAEQITKYVYDKYKD